MEFDVHIVGIGIVESVDAVFAFVLRRDERGSEDEPVELAAAVVVLWNGLGKILYPEVWVAVGVDRTAADVFEHGSTCGRRALEPLRKGAAASVGELVCRMVGRPELAELSVAFVDLHSRIIL